jgi:hypothetical protein
MTRAEALKAAYYDYEAAYKEASEIAAVAVEAAYAIFNAELDRINEEYPQ